MGWKCAWVCVLTLVSSVASATNLTAKDFQAMGKKYSAPETFISVRPYDKIIAKVFVGEATRCSQAKKVALDACNDWDTSARVKLKAKPAWCLEDSCECSVGRLNARAVCLGTTEYQAKFFTQLKDDGTLTGMKPGNRVKELPKVKAEAKGLGCMEARFNAKAALFSQLEKLSGEYELEEIKEVLCRCTRKFKSFEHKATCWSGITAEYEAAQKF